jgi:hypothetical protein
MFILKRLTEGCLHLTPRQETLIDTVSLPLVCTPLIWLTALCPLAAKLDKQTLWTINPYWTI